MAMCEAYTQRAVRDDLGECERGGCGIAVEVTFYEV